jgi:phosphinothricin acetyltransferase
MTVPFKIRVAEEKDAEAILAIYAPFCLSESAVSFEIEPPTVDDMRSRIASTLESLPWIVCVDSHGHVLGYAYASQHKSRLAYRWSVDVSIYLSVDARRQGVGARLYRKLFEILKDLGYINAYAGIALPNDASVALHKALDFVEVGVYEQVGFKGGKWHDVIWLAMTIQEHVDSPTEPIQFAQYLGIRAKSGASPEL